MALKRLKQRVVNWAILQAVRPRLRQALQWVQEWRVSLPSGEGSMNVWLKALLAAFVGGAITGALDGLANGLPTDVAGWRRLGVTVLSGGLIAVLAYLKQSPLNGNKSAGGADVPPPAAK